MAKKIGYFASHCFGCGTQQELRCKLRRSPFPRVFRYVQHVHPFCKYCARRLAEIERTGLSAASATEALRYEIVRGKFNPTNGQKNHARPHA